jgi:capsular exopolysaccharide synthesis family protein
MPQLVELAELQRKYGSGHPEVISLRNKIDTAREILKGTNPGARGKLPASPAMPESTVLAAGPCSIGMLAAPNGQGPLLAATTLVATRSVKWETLHYVELLRAQLHDVQLTEQALKDLAEKAAKEVRDMAGFRNQDSTLRKEIANKEKQWETFTTLRNDRNTLGSGGGYKAEAIAPPGQGVQVEPKPAPIFTVALMLGLGAGVLLAWLAEATDKSFRTPEEVRRRLGLPVVGHVPRITPRNEEVRQHEAGTLALDPSICAYYQSKSIEAESFRGIRTTLYFSAQNEGCKIIQITSPNMGDGKTTLATNLAVSIAQSGKRILLIDADFRRPRLHRMFGLRARIGLATIIQDDTDLGDAIQQTAVPNLSILPCGPRPNNPAELLTSPRFKQALEALRDKFDVILVDTPPLLAVSDPSVVASQVDGVLMTIRVSKNGRPSAERARDILASIEANVLGVVVNGIGSRSKEGYGASHYGYQYQYQYAYEPTDNRSYYQDNEPDSQIHRNGAGSNGLAPQTARNDEPIDPDAVDIGAMPVKPEPQRVRERVPNSRRKEGEKPGVVGGLTRWLRSTLWH